MKHQDVLITTATLALLVFLSSYFIKCFEAKNGMYRLLLIMHITRLTPHCIYVAIIIIIIPTWCAVHMHTTVVLKEKNLYNQ